MDFAIIGIWAGGAITVVGLLQWFKGLAPGAPSWIWGIAAAALALGYAAAPPWAQTGAGILAVSQIGYEQIVQRLKAKLGAGA